MSLPKGKSRLAVVTVILIAIIVGGSYLYVASQRAQTDSGLLQKQKDFQKTFTYVQIQDPKIFGYPLVRASYNRFIQKDTYETLVRYVGPSMDYKPGLATSWEISSDNLVYTFHLRQGVKFYPSGDPFNATAVKFTFDQAFRTSPPPTAPIDLFGPSNWVQYDGTQIVDNYTVKISIKRPLAWFMRMVDYVQIGGITNPNWVNAHGGPPKSMTTVDPYFQWHQDTTASYYVDEFRSGDRVILKRNPTWWGWNSTLLGRAPEQVVVRVVPEASTRLLLLARGDADLGYVDLQYLPELKNRIVSEHLPLLVDDKPTLEMMYIVLDFKNAPTNDLHIRKMLAYSFNYDGFIKNVLNGYGDRLLSFVPKGAWGYQPDVPHYEFDLDKAKQELGLAAPENQAMVTQGVKVRYTPGYAINKQGYLLWKSDLAKIGVNLILDEVSYSAYRDTMTSGGVPILDRAWNPDFPDPATHYQFIANSFYVAKQFGTTPVSIDDTIEKAAFEANPDQRLQIYRQVEQWDYDTVAYIKVASKIGGSDTNVRGNWVKGFYPVPLDDHKAIYWEVWKELPQQTIPALLKPALGQTPFQAVPCPTTKPS